MAASTLAPPRITIAAQPRLCGLAIFVGDVVAVALAAAIAIGGRYWFHGKIDVLFYVRMWPAVLMFTSIYAIHGLYPGVTLSPVREIRQLTLSSTLVFGMFTALLFLFKEGHEFSRVGFLAAWLLTLFFVPLMRALLRFLLGRRSWWGYPVVVFGACGTAQRIVADLRRNPHVGLTPVAAFDNRAVSSIDVDSLVPLLGGLAEAGAFAKREGLTRALIAIPDLAGNDLAELLDSYPQAFSRFYILPEVSGLSSLVVEPRELCNRVTLEIKRSLLLPECQLAKSSIDAVLGVLLGILFLPLMVLIAILIRIESPGPVFFAHRRIGREGREFTIWKFRTMHRDSDRMLHEHFRKHPKDRLEWERDRKLRVDPRVTRLGRILRKTSLDELPQLWNVIRRNMSLVGPRPIVTEEIAKYGKSFGMYCRVIPGLTGLWQVSGRSETDYQQRVDFDTYYVRNWSPWFDIYLLARTFLVVIKGQGAY